MGVTWRDGRLAAKQLFDALKACGLDPDQHCYCNWFEWGGKAAVRRHNGPIVAMGLKVQRDMERRGVPFVPLVHPAARGKIRKKSRYIAHVRRTLRRVLP